MQSVLFSAQFQIGLRKTLVLTQMRNPRLIQVPLDEALGVGDHLGYG
jgi:hypothetical protein